MCRPMKSRISKRFHVLFDCVWKLSSFLRLTPFLVFFISPLFLSIVDLGGRRGGAGGTERSFFDGWTEEGTALWGIISRLRSSRRSGLQRCEKRALGPAGTWTLGASAPSSSEGGRVSK